MEGVNSFLWGGNIDLDWRCVTGLNGKVVELLGSGSGRAIGWI